MVYRIEFLPAAARELKKLAKSASNRDKRAIVSAIDNLQENPRPTDAKKLSGGNSLYRVRVGNFRIVYQIRDNLLLVLVAKVADRNDVYARGLDDVASRLHAYLSDDP